MKLYHVITILGGKRVKYLTEAENAKAAIEKVQKNEVLQDHEGWVANQIDFEITPVYVTGIEVRYV